jgi:non-ribosomal peptide synthetase component F
VNSLDSIAENVIAVDDALIESLASPVTPVESDAKSHNAAYIIPTSGTTGQPKLTLLEHGNFCTGAKEHIPGLLLNATMPVRALQFAAHSFDASIVSILALLQK